ncbi:uncharacterized protein [Rutidosis leptorrhynchoides]|uniref:uncharacterized protein n=1 Tax=Rutidosis leptorrhynchoides TaxID=125765 RepID=UPI003A9A13DB
MHPETLIVMRDLTNLMSNADVLLDKVRNNPQIRENLRTIMRTADQVLRGFDENNQEANSNPFTAVLGGGDLGGAAQNQAANLATTGGDLGGAETTTGSPAPSTDPLPNPGAAAGGQVSSVEQCGSGLGGSTFPELSLINLVKFPELEQMHPETLNLMRVYVNLLNNLEVMFDQVMEDPETREFLDRNPEIGYKLNDPATKRRMEALRNHALKTEILREMMRFADRVLSLIDAFAAGGGDLGGAETTTGSPALNTDPLPNPCAAAGGKHRLFPLFDQLICINIIIYALDVYSNLHKSAQWWRYKSATTVAVYITKLKRLNPKDLKMIRELVLDIGNEHDLAALGRKMEDLKMAALSNPERLRRIMRNIDLVIVGIEEKVMKAKSNMFAAVLGGGDPGGVAQNQAANRATTGGRVLKKPYRGKATSLILQSNILKNQPRVVSVPFCGLLKKLQQIVSLYITSTIK